MGSEMCIRDSARELDHTLTSPWLEEAFALFQRAATLSHDPVFVTGAYYTMRALDEVERWEDQAGGPVQLVQTAAGGGSGSGWPAESRGRTYSSPAAVCTSWTGPPA